MPGLAIYEVIHGPTVPAAGQPVVVTARVHDPDGLQTLTLHYRVDPNTGYTPIPMTDDGTSGDAIAGDGIYSAMIPGLGAGAIAAFYISATDNASAATRFPALLDDNSPVRECLVRFGDGNPVGSFGVYHLWITQANITRWASLSDLSNESSDCTFVNSTRVIYNMQGRFAGSPYHQTFNTPNGNLCHYKWTFFDDDKFLGATSFNKIHQPGNGPGDDPSIQREQTAYMFMRALRVPWLNRRYVAVYVNGNRRGYLMEDTQVPDGDMVKEHWPNDSGGDLYKMQPWFEFAPAPSGISIGFNNNSWCNLVPYTTTGGLKNPARYRYNFEMRRTTGSDNDFTNVFSLIDAANSYGTPNYVANMENLANMENWMRVFAASHAAGNLDSFGAQNAQNLYGYIGTQGTKYSLMMWDYNIVIGNSGSWGPGENLFTVNGEDPNMSNIYNNPTFRRMYWRALQELVNGPLNIANSGPLIDAKYNAFVANGLNVENTSAIKTWLSQAQSSIATQLAAVNAASFTVNPAVSVNNNVATVQGTAPVAVKTVWINGVEYPVTWTSLTGWSVSVPLQPGTNQLGVVAMDIHGQPIAGTSNSVAAVYNGVLPSPAGQIVINEIMYNPPAPNAQYVELYNSSGALTFDLSGWQFSGLGYTFPAGSIIGPNGYLVLAANRPAFAAAYGATIPVFDTFSGQLSSTGALLTLLQPGANGTSNVMAQVQYGSAAPWPAAANGAGSSLQLIDPRQDNWRAGNWGAVLTNSPPSAQWQYVTLTGVATKSILLIGMTTPGDVYVDDLKLVAGSVPEAGTNMLQDGDFESPLSGPWTVSTNMTNSGISTNFAHSGSASLHVVASSGGPLIAEAIWQNTLTLVTNATYTLSYWYLPSTDGSSLLIRLSGSSPNNGDIYSLQSFQPPAPSSLVYTPGAVNSVNAILPPFPPLWLNEVEADNLTGITNSAGQHAGWLELYNPTTNSVSLNGLYLANDYSNLTAWAFPAGAVVSPGQFLVVFADGQTNLSTLAELHTSFALAGGSGSVALSRLYQGQPQVLDYVNYAGLPADSSYGSLPDGQSFNRQEFFLPTPGKPNGASGAGSFIPYASAGSVYAQDFNSLPNPGLTSVNTANPVAINGITYSLANPFDFAGPVASSGNAGGLGLPALAGWYGLADPSASVGTRFGATDGDQTAGGQLDFGLPGSPDRALGLLATSTTGFTAFGVKFINDTGQTLNYINLQYTAEVWRQSNLAKTLEFYYFIDPTASHSFSTNATAFLPALNAGFPTVASDVGGAAVDGTAPGSQTVLAVVNQPITNWPPGAALWLVWEMESAAGKSQGLAVDNLGFSATAPAPWSSVSMTAQASGGQVVLNWPGMPGQMYQLQYKTNLSDSVWLPIGGPAYGTGADVSLTNNLDGAQQRFYRLAILPPGP